MLFLGNHICSFFFKGKTIIAEWIAAKAGFKFIYLTPADLEHELVGRTSKNWRKVFKDASRVGPTIIFFDELGKALV